MSKYAYILFSLLFAACSGSPEKSTYAGTEEVKGGNRYAERFSIRDAGEFKIMEVKDPWQNSRGQNFHYLLGRNPVRIPDSLMHLPFIHTPVEKVIALSTTHVAMLCQLGRRESLLGVSNVTYVYDSILRDRAGDGLVAEVGYDQNLNYETIVSLDPDVLFIYGVEGAVNSVAGKLSDLGVPVVFCAEYLEKHPLGKAEWIRFFASFFEMEKEAGEFFKGIDSSYCKLRSLCPDRGTWPAVLSGLPWKDTWYIPGGNSFAAHLIKDAGGDYLWKDHPSAEAVAMDLESVFSRAVEADVWINPGGATNLESIRAYDNRFSDLVAMNGRRVYNNNARVSPGGGNDYWESGTIRPDLILADLIKVFHPHLLPDHRLFYYRELK